MIKCCGTCNKITDTYALPENYWCILADEPVKFDEYCDSWSKRE